MRDSATCRLPKRSTRYGVGKEIGGAVYVHRQYEDVLNPIASLAKTHLPKDFDYAVVKYNLETSAVSFIQSPDFDTEDEPTVGDIATITADGRCRIRKQPSDPHIYHHKWLFVADDYRGFDVEASKRRSLAWLSLHEVDTRRIGKRSYWQEIVVPRISRA